MATTALVLARALSILAFGVGASTGSSDAGVKSSDGPGGADPNKETIILYTPTDPFRQLEEILPTPNPERAPSGAPGHAYWQQEVDYDIEVEIDDETQRLRGLEKVKYQNNSPDELRYLWLQLDANIYAPDSDRELTSTAPTFDRMGYRSVERLLAAGDFDGSVQIKSLKSGRDDLKYTVVGTMMRIDLPKPLAPGRSVKFELAWEYAINDSDKVGGRTGFEHFEKDDNNIYEIAQWFPRLAAYNDVTGWQHKQYLGRGEFTLEFGDYDVEITVPSDHVVASTGELKNAKKVLDKKQLERLDKARESKAPVFIVTPEEAKKAEGSKAKSKKTWKFEAKNVRDFAFATSRKFIWDAQGYDVDKDGKPEVMAMSFYPNEGEPLWSKYSTRAIVHTLEVYGRYTFQYPYPTAISVNGPVGGMEYPMICFNGPRPEEDGTYSKRTKYGLISVIIHEVGHNFFPMIVNSDERQWTWMDEGLNTFLQYLTEQEWEPEYPSRRGEPRDIVDYMASADQVPIMTNSESLLQFGNNAYAKTATALNILRETVLGREAFDFAFKEYARRWQFKRPMPSDFFRTMEDASGTDLDWFWRGWFYSNAHTDQALLGFAEYTIDTQDPEVEKPRQKAERDGGPESLSKRRNREIRRLTDELPELKDFYNEFDELDVTPADRERYAKSLEALEPDEKALLSRGERFYVVDIANEGGLVMPVILEVHYADGSKDEMRIPAEIWRQGDERVSKTIVSKKEVVRIVLDPHLETADVDLSDNEWPPKPKKSRFQMFKWDEKQPNPMQQAAAAKEKAEGSDEKADDNADAKPAKASEQ